MVRLRLDEPVPGAVGERVRLIVLVGEEEEPNKQDWLRAATRGGAFDFLSAPEEDLYTLRDGKAFEHAR
jgi:hypothetical protein